MMTFQEIWTLFNTQNELITNIIGIPSIFIEIFISMLIFTTLLNINYSKKQKIIYVLITSTISIISRFLLPLPINTFVNLLGVLISIFIIFKTNFFKGIVAIFFPTLLAAFFESIFARVYFLIFNINYMEGSNIPLHRLLGTLIIYISMFVMYLLIKNFKINLNRLDSLSKKNKALLIANFSFGIVLIGLQIYMITFFISNLPIGVTLISIFTLITYFLINIYTTITLSKLEITTMNLEQAEQHNKTLELLQDNTRAFRHDLSNIVQGMYGYIDNNDMEGLKKYYTQFTQDIQHTNNLMTLSPKVINNPAVYNVLANKYHKADEQGIKINLDAFLDLNTLQIKIYEFTRVLGILMDNAIEAASETEEKIINVTLKKDSKKQLLIIENSYTEKDINTEKIYEKGYSTKTGNSGLGLWEIRQILKKNKNLNLFTSKNDKFFSQQFEIYI